jgi:hypothetical protein
MLFWWGFMSRNGLDGRRRGSILVQLGATAGVLVLPPLMLSAGVALFGSQTEDRLQIAADRSVASAVSKSSALIAFSPRPREIPKSAERPPLHDEPAAKAAPPSAVAEAVVVEAVIVESDESSTAAETDAAAEPLPFLGPVPVTLVVVRKDPEPEEPEPEETTAAPAPPASAPPPVASIAPVVPHATPKPPPAHVAHPRVKADREEARTPRRIAEKRPHAPAAARASTATRPAGAASHRATASAASKAKPKSGLQHRADLEN